MRGLYRLQIASVFDSCLDIGDTMISYVIVEYRIRKTPKSESNLND